ncbi:MAG: DUF4178 domain-containing protein [Leptospiraceae bacterium]|nr:DUF4178 domain-containing protein [Leptospiraceae bacterium]MCP5512658.1 DUF4178 domain-containing protein [Leptospiraceae bacterium]
MKSNCPSCGAELVFKSKISVMTVCEYCNSVIVRHDMNLENLGKVSEIQEDMSPLQVGTTGNYGSKKFEIIGRQKASYSDGFWNEWYIYFSDYTDGWLAEAQGYYMVSVEVKEGVEIPNKNSVKVGLTVQINKIPFSIDDIKEITYIGCEGELPVKSLVGSKALSVDLSGPDNNFCNIVYANDGNFVYLGKYIEFEDFQFKYLRELDGWK